MGRFLFRFAANRAMRKFGMRGQERVVYLPPNNADRNFIQRWFMKDFVAFIVACGFIWYMFRLVFSAFGQFLTFLPMFLYWAHYMFRKFRPEKYDENNFEVAELPQIQNEKMILYNHWFSLNSQKVRMYLEERNITYENLYITKINNNLYSPAFSEFEQGVDTVLYDKGELIKGFLQIIEYIDKTYPPEVSPDPKEKQIIDYWVKKCDINKKFISEPEKGLGDCILPLSLPIYASFLFKFAYWDLLYGIVYNIKMVKFLVKLKFKGIQFLKQNEETRQMMIESRINIQKYFKELEQHLEKYEEDWICKDTFTLADISIAVILERIAISDNDHIFMNKDENKQMHWYWCQLQKRESFIKAVREFKQPMQKDATEAIQKWKKNLPQMTEILGKKKKASFWKFL